jgi:hypothetical protein
MGERIECRHAGGHRSPDRRQDGVDALQSRIARQLGHDLDMI